MKLHHDEDEVGVQPNGSDPSGLTRQLIGSRLKKLREDLGLSLRDAANRASLSHSFVAMVEKGESEIAVSRLIRLADVYGTGLSDLLDGGKANNAEFVAAGATYSFPTGMDDVTIQYLSSPSWELQPFKVCLRPGAQLEDLRHPGDEFVHCTAGTPTIVVDRAHYPMHPNDTVVVPHQTLHSYFNATDAPATLIGAVSRLKNQPGGGSIV